MLDFVTGAAKLPSGQGDAAMFRLLRLKPPNGWHSVGWELLIVTLGVLIALGAQQLVERARDARVAEQTRTAISEEINQNLLNISLRATAETCVDRRLDELHVLVATWGRTGRFETPLWVAQAPRLTMRLPRYRAALDAGNLALLPTEEQDRMGVVIEVLTEFQKLQEEETEAWATLRMLQDGADSLSSTDRTAVRLSLQRAAALDYQARLSIRQILPRAAQFDSARTAKGLRSFRETSGKTAATRRRSAPRSTRRPRQANEMTGQQTPLPF